MWFPSFLRSLDSVLGGKNGSRARTRQGRKQMRLSLESLEPRCLLSTVPNDPMFNRLDGLEIIEADRAWNLTTGSTQVTVAVIDTGVDYTHRDLYKNIWVNQAEIPTDIRGRLQDLDSDGLITFWDLNEPINQGPEKISDLNATGFIDGGDLLRPAAAGGWADNLDNGSNGFIDDLIGWDFGHNDNDPMDFNDHGTHVAGTIGAVGNNGIGVVGVNWKVQIMPVKRVTDVSTGTGQNTFDAMYYAVDNGAEVSNNSWGFSAATLTEADLSAAYAASQYADSKGHLIVAAAHNQGSDNDVAPVVPASYDLPNIISVAATDKHDKLAKFSNYGAVSVDLAAPGVGISSTVANSHYARFNGTSMATPHVAGAAALILAHNPDLTYTQVRDLIFANVDPLPELLGKTVTGGRLNLYKALSATSVGGPVAPAPTEATTFSGPPATATTAGRGESTSAALASVPQLSIGDVSGTDELFALTVALSMASPVSVMVNDGTAPGSAIPGLLFSDSVSTADTLTFALGEIANTITVQVVDDKEREGDETFIVNLNEPINALLADAQELGTIRKHGDKLIVGDPA